MDGEFSSFPEVHRTTVKNLTAKGYVNLFPIQQHCFYPVYFKKDLIARDLTGSGKTFAFGLPLVERMRREKLLGNNQLKAIILAPTRELALQVTNELTKLKHKDNEFKIVTVYGGVSIDDQTRELRRGVDIFVGTTGRVLDHIQRENIDFSNLRAVVLDEADIMLKLGFKEDVDQIMQNVRQHLKTRKF
jgi:superfamily II DNA/RNA helicase